MGPTALCTLRGNVGQQNFNDDRDQAVPAVLGGIQTSPMRPCVFAITARTGECYAAQAASFYPMPWEGCDQAPISSTVQWWVPCQLCPPLTDAEPVSNKQLVYLGSGFQLDQMTKAIQDRDHHVGRQASGMAGRNDGVFCAPDDFDWHGQTSQLRA